MSTIFEGTSFLIKKKFLKLLGSDFRVENAQGKDILFAHLKAFKWKEDITLYTDETKTEGIINIKARTILDFSSAYDFVDLKTNQKIGAAKRKGFKSILQDEWLIMDANDKEIGKVQEDSFLLAMVRRILTALVPQKFEITVNGKNVGQYKNNFNPFLSKVAITLKEPDENFSASFAIALGILICAIEGKQG
ncbi:MAG: hypothetical protein IAF38_07100 [Bacteroidia bacterium]|nr:hypothetical protein [Bacteroidia bacterium]